MTKERSSSKWNAYDGVIGFTVEDWLDIFYRHRPHYGKVLVLDTAGGTRKIGGAYINPMCGSIHIMPSQYERNWARILAHESLHKTLCEMGQVAASYQIDHPNVSQLIDQWVYHGIWSGR